MKPLIQIVFSLYLVTACNKREKTELAVQGKWKNGNEKNGEQIIFNDKNYYQTEWNDDLIHETKGMYFIVENPHRKSASIFLVPNLVYRNQDTLILPCEVLDITKKTDSSFFVQVPTRWVGEGAIKNTSKQYTKVNP